MTESGRDENPRRRQGSISNRETMQGGARPASPVTARGKLSSLDPRRWPRTVKPVRAANPARGQWHRDTSGDPSPPCAASASTDSGDPGRLRYCHRQSGSAHRHSAPSIHRRAPQRSTPAATTQPPVFAACLPTGPYHVFRKVLRHPYAACASLPAAGKSAELTTKAAGKNPRSCAAAL